LDRTKDVSNTKLVSLCKYVVTDSLGVSHCCDFTIMKASFNRCKRMEGSGRRFSNSWL